MFCLGWMNDGSLKKLLERTNSLAFFDREVKWKQSPEKLKLMEETLATRKAEILCLLVMLTKHFLVWQWSSVGRLISRTRAFSLFCLEDIYFFFRHQVMFGCPNAKLGSIVKLFCVSCFWILYLYFLSLFFLLLCCYGFCCCYYYFVVVRNCS